MIISILNCDKEFGIGKKNGLLFELPLDMKFFRETTKGHVVAMGENTLLSFPGAKPLKNRTNIVLSQDPTHNYEGVINVHSFDDFLQAINEKSRLDDVFIIGGASIYRQTLPYADKVLLTKVNAIGGAEVFFPNIDTDSNFECVDEGKPLNDNGFEIRFTTYLNKDKKQIPTLFSFKGNVDEISETRLELQKSLLSKSVFPIIANRFLLCFDEIVLMIISHDKKSETNIKLYVDANKEYASLSFKDDNEPFDIFLDDNPLTKISIKAIKKVTDIFKYEYQNGNVVTIVKNYLNTIIS